MTTKPVPVEATGNQDVDAILWGYKWDARALTYAFPESSAEYLRDGYFGVSGFQAFDAAQQAAVKDILGNIASFTKLTFRDVTGTAETGLLRFAEAEVLRYTDDGRVASDTDWHSPGYGSAEANPPELGFGGAPSESASFAQGDGWFNPKDYDDATKGGFGYSAGLMHETGHNLGLKHGHVEQEGHGTLFPKLSYKHNSLEYSVMTYSQFPGHRGDFDDAPNHPTTYMQNDILALQTLYGANYDYRSGKTVYRWSAETGEMFVNGVGQGASDSNHILMTVWDGGGLDTYDLSNYTDAAIIDLRPGAWTTTSTEQLANLGTNGGKGPAHFARGTIANALLFDGSTASLIENAVGGSGDDRIIGNQAANRLDGGRGADRMEGREGDDTYLVDDGRDRVIEATGQGHDTVLSSTSFVLSAGQEIETLQLLLSTGKAALDLTGNAFAQTLRGNAGDNVLNGKGGADALHGRGGDDRYFVDEAGDLVFEGRGNGTDTVVASTSYTLQADQEVEVLRLLLATGKTALDLTGNAFGQTLRGNEGDNRLDGAAGADILTGKGGADSFVFSTKLGAGNVDHITDFAVADDTIRLSEDIFAALSPGWLAASAFRTVGGAASAVAERDDRILYDRKTGDLFYDADGGDAGGRIKFAVVDNHAALSAHDFLIA